MNRPRADEAIRWSTVAVVVAVAAGAAVVSYRHAYELVRAHGETGLTGAIVPATVDGMIYASSMVLLLAARRGNHDWRELWLAYLGLTLGICGTVAANVAHGLAHGPVGAVVGAWPAVALVISYETLMWIVRASRPDQPAPADAEPCQCGEGGEQVAPVARTLLDAAVAAVRDGMSQRRAEEEFGVNRKKLSAALNQPEEVAPAVAPIEPARIPETV
jgi:hypothetical protein